MKSFTAISSLLLLGAASVFAAPVSEREVPAPTEMDITSFSANTLPHGDGAL